MQPSIGLSGPPSAASLPSAAPAGSQYTIQTVVNLLAYVALATLSSFWGGWCKISYLMQATFVTAMCYDAICFRPHHARSLTLCGRVLSIVLINCLVFWTVPFPQRGSAKACLLVLSIAQMAICALVTYKIPPRPIFANSTQDIETLQRENRNLSAQLASANAQIRQLTHQDTQRLNE